MAAKPSSEAFLRFWKAYPLRPANPRAAADAAFVKLLKAGEDAEALIAAAGRFKADCARRAIDPEFIPYAKTWLAQRRFEDFPAPASDSAPGPESPLADHPLGFLLGAVHPDYFASWLAPLRVEVRDGGLFVIAKTNIARDRVQRDCGDDIAQALGAFTWTVERTSAA